MTKPRKQWEYRFRMKPWSQLMAPLRPVGISDKGPLLKV